MPLIQLHSLTNLSPPLISLATLSSFPPGEAKAAAPQREAKSLPYGCDRNHAPTATNGVHPLSLTFVRQLPQRWSQGGCAARVAC